MSRDVLMRSFLDRYLPAEYQIFSLLGDASFRRYHRIVCGNDTYLLMDAPPEKESVHEFIHIAQILKQAVNVPDILHKDVQNGFLLLQDFGEVEFAHLIEQNKPNHELYQKALHTLHKLQQIDIHAIDILPYSDEKYKQEMDLFVQWFLPYIEQNIDSAIWNIFTDTIIQEIQKQPKVLVHRDYHSRNLMQDKNSDDLGVIDFQDALIGAYSYDLVSLVKDAYVDFDMSWAHEQVQAFYQIAKIQKPLEEFIYDVNIMGIQRHLKVLGIFVRLAQRDGKQKYLENIPKVMQDLIDELNWICQYHNKPIYQDFWHFIQKIQPSYHKKFQNSITKG